MSNVKRWQVIIICAWFCFINLCRVKYIYVAFSCLQVVLIVNFVDFTPLSVGDYVMPPWAQALGWGMALVSIICIPIWACIAIWQSYKDPKIAPDYEGLSFPRVSSICLKYSVKQWNLQYKTIVSYGTKFCGFKWWVVSYQRWKYTEIDFAYV